MGAFVLARQAIAEENKNGEDGDGEGREVAADPVKKLKQTAYNAGLWHGFILGLSIAYVGIVVYARSGKSSNRR